jgi:chromate transporter
MVISLVKERKTLPIIVMVGAFIATYILNINIIIIIIASGLIGVAGMLYTDHIKKSGEIK